MLLLTHIAPACSIAAIIRWQYCVLRHCCCVLGWKSHLVISLPFGCVFDLDTSRPGGWSCLPDAAEQCSRNRQLGTSSLSPKKWRWRMRRLPQPCSWTLPLHQCKQMFLSCAQRLWLHLIYRFGQPATMQIESDSADAMLKQLHDTGLGARHKSNNATAGCACGKSQ